MKFYFLAIAMFFIALCGSLNAKKAELYTSKYFIFQSNAMLNAHFLMINKAQACRLAGVQNDSMSYFVFKDKTRTLTVTDFAVLNKILIFYKDSIDKIKCPGDSLIKNLLDYSYAGLSIKNKFKTIGWNQVYKNLKLFQPYYNKFFQAATDSINMLWLNAFKMQITNLENEMLPNLARIYKTELPLKKIKIDLCCYMNNKSVYRFNEIYNFVICPLRLRNANDSTLENIFNQASFLIAGKLTKQLAAICKNKTSLDQLKLKEDIIIYSTAFLLEKQYRLKWQKFVPSYVQTHQSEKDKPFKIDLEACQRFWSLYISGDGSFEAALTNMVDFASDFNK